MPASRLALAAVVSLRAVLVYGEATGAAEAELTWRELVPAGLRGLSLPRGVAAPRVATGGSAPARAVAGPTA